MGLLQALRDERPLTPGTVVESTSGDPGPALARLLPSVDCVFLAVADLKTPHATRGMLTERGARVTAVDEPDGRGGHLLSRLRTVRELCGGTLTGISAHLRAHRPDVAAIAVDVRCLPAVAKSAGRRLSPDIGASRPSAFLKKPHSYDRAVCVDDIEAIAVCRILAEDVGLVLGGSSGCAARALLTDRGNGRADDRLAVCPAADDGGGKYRDTLYSDDRATEQGVVKEITAVEQPCREGLFFDRKHQEH
ncbi:pyridoxal-phosphate dependent enzyme [Streptomyces sp. NPDC058092]|uniref:pyridoxal-phosphate dependent enzyme n=1 Tax=Streptomyces sp. NPDC058092 TaxID=3346336 RepID=UPI0036EBF215